MSLIARVDIVLVEPGEGGNVGRAARALKNMGFAAMHLVNPRYQDREAARMAAVHAGDLLRAARIHDSVEAAVSGAAWVVAVSGRDHEYPERKSVLDPGAFIRRLRELPEGSRCTLLFGSERFGLTNAQAKFGQDILTFPTSDRYPSMNLGQAVAVTAWEIRRADLGIAGGLGEPVPAAAAPRARITAGEIEGLLSHLRRTLGIVGFLNPQNPELILDDLRRMVARSRLDARELSILRGILHRLDVWIAQHGGPPTPNSRNSRGRS